MKKIFILLIFGLLVFGCNKPEEKKLEIKTIDDLAAQIDGKIENGTIVYGSCQILPIYYNGKLAATTSLEQVSSLECSSVFLARLKGTTLEVSDEKLEQYIEAFHDEIKNNPMHDTSIQNDIIHVRATASGFEFSVKEVKKAYKESLGE